MADTPRSVAATTKSTSPKKETSYPKSETTKSRREKLDFEKELERQISDENLAENEPEPLENPKREITKKGNFNNKLQLRGDRPKKEIVATGSSEEFDKENQSAVANQRWYKGRGRRRIARSTNT